MHKLYVADPKLAPQVLEDRRKPGFTVTAHHADGPTHIEALRAEAAFLADPNWRTARDFLWAAFADLEPFLPDKEVGDVVESDGWVPTGRILVTQGRALPEFSEPGYAAFCLAYSSGGWDCNEFTGDVLWDAGLDGSKFPSLVVDLVEDDEDPHEWLEKVEPINL